MYGFGADNDSILVQNVLRIVTLLAASSQPHELRHCRFSYCKYTTNQFTDAQAIYAKQ